MSSTFIFSISTLFFPSDHLSDISVKNTPCLQHILFEVLLQKWEEQSICSQPGQLHGWSEWGVIVGWWFWGGWWMSLIAACALGQAGTAGAAWAWTLVPTLPLTGATPAGLGAASVLIPVCSCLSLNGVMGLRDSPCSLCIKSAVQETEALISEAWTCLSRATGAFPDGRLSMKTNLVK